jgi:hypothetical protein
MMGGLLAQIWTSGWFNISESTTHYPRPVTIACRRVRTYLTTVPEPGGRCPHRSLVALWDIVGILGNDKQVYLFTATYCLQCIEYLLNNPLSRNMEVVRGMIC